MLKFIIRLKLFKYYIKMIESKTLLQSREMYERYNYLYCELKEKMFNWVEMGWENGF